MEKYFDPEISHDEMRKVSPGLMTKAEGFDAESIRETLQKRRFLPQNIVRYCYRPFDVRWIYWEPDTKLLDRNRAEYFPHVFKGNLWIEARQKQPMERFDRGYFVTVLSDNFGNGLSNYFPLYLNSSHLSNPLLSYMPEQDKVSNISDKATEYLEGLAIRGPETIFFHTLAILHSPDYRFENAGGLRQDWPRIPLSKSKDVLLGSAVLGRKVSVILDTESQAFGITTGKLRPELTMIAKVSRKGGETLNPDAGDLCITAGWGHSGKGGVTMPGQGKMVERDYSPDELTAFRDGAQAMGLTEAQVFQHLGNSTCDIYLNGIAYWKNIPAKVWNYTIGG